ncbi:hypothetical protein QVD17_28039 [Tagetes erecta]|uniref:Uncharacterized protein n=1 Tax=Tagetes erecta TaxID=13708 RepID=A0AAD8KA31_TARER|nr:hypothetical protein QVD17_28039 [Tagetes erecta]
MNDKGGPQLKDEDGRREWCDEKGGEEEEEEGRWRGVELVEEVSLFVLNHLHSITSISRVFNPQFAPPITSLE